MRRIISLVLTILIILPLQACAQDWSKPDLSSSKTEFMTQLHDIINQCAKMDYSGGSNIPDNALRYNRTTKRIEEYDSSGGTWTAVLVAGPSTMLSPFNCLWSSFSNPLVTNKSCTWANWGVGVGHQFFYLPKAFRATNLVMAMTSVFVSPSSVQIALYKNSSPTGETITSDFSNTLKTVAISPIDYAAGDTIGVRVGTLVGSPSQDEGAIVVGVQGYFLE